MTALRLVINGAAGRMGQRLIALGSADSALKIVAALEYAGSSQLGRDSGAVAGIGVPIAATLDVAAEALIDFSTPASPSPPC
jgi:4-hydroxy-tetrahydrodipicolinate reductase